MSVSQSPALCLFTPRAESCWIASPGETDLTFVLRLNRTTWYVRAAPAVPGSPFLQMRKWTVLVQSTYQSTRPRTNTNLSPTLYNITRKSEGQGKTDRSLFLKRPIAGSGLRCLALSNPKTLACKHISSWNVLWCHHFSPTPDVNTSSIGLCRVNGVGKTCQELCVWASPGTLSHMKARRAA